MGTLGGVTGWGLRGGALLRGIGARIRRDTRELVGLLSLLLSHPSSHTLSLPSCPSAHVRTKEGGHLKARKRALIRPHSYAETLILDLQSPDYEKINSCYLSYLSLWVLLELELIQ